MSGRLQGKTALITGGTSGIGEASVEAFVAEGAQVVIAARNAEKGAQMVARLGPATRFVQTDVSREDEIKRAVDATVDAFGRLDCLFNNAGGPAPGTLETVTPQEFSYAMGLLLGSVVFGMRHAAPVMKAQGRGAIINNSSVRRPAHPYGRVSLLHGQGGGQSGHPSGGDGARGASGSASTPSRQGPSPRRSFSAARRPPTRWTRPTPTPSWPS